MIVVDTSAIVAILFDEERGDVCRDALVKAAPNIALSAGTLFEIEIVTSKPAAHVDATIMIERLRAEVVPVTADFSRRAGEYYRQWGRGFHPAKLNMGDCYAYTLAKQLNRPLLFIGNDFSQTDILSVLENPGPEQL